MHLDIFLVLGDCKSYSHWIVFTWPIVVLKVHWVPCAQATQTKGGMQVHDLSASGLVLQPSKEQLSRLAANVSTTHRFESAARLRLRLRRDATFFRLHDNTTGRLA